MTSGAKSTCFLFLLLLPILSSTANNYSSIINVENKKEQSEFFAKKFIEYFNDNKTDSVIFILSQWERETGMNEALFRAYSLFLVNEGKFPGQLLQYSLLENAIAWEIRHGLIYDSERQDYFQTHTSFFSFLEIGDKFDRFTINAARRLLAHTENGSLANAYMKLYAGDINDFFFALPSGKHSDNLLGHEYREKYNELINMPETHLAVTFGAWLPNGHLSAIGIRPAVGVRLGRQYNKLLADFAFDIRIGKSDNKIDIPLTDEVMLEVDHFIGMRAAIEPSYNILKWQPINVDVFFSAGYEWIELVKSGQDRRGETFGSPSIGAGITYRYLFANRLNIGFSTAYHLLWFDNPGGTSLEGHALTVSLNISYFENPRKKIGLNRFGINYW